MVLNLQEQIHKTCKSGFFHLYNIRRIRKYLSQESARTLVHAFIIGRIDYCNSLLFGLPSVHLLKLQRLQNAAARLISNVPRYSHITPVLCSLHWLPVKFRIDLKYFFLLLKLSTVMRLVTSLTWLLQQNSRAIISVQLAVLPYNTGFILARCLAGFPQFGKKNVA